MQDPLSADRLKKKRVLYAMSAVILGLAVVIAVAPTRVPVPMRLAAALGDLMAAAFVWLAARQITPTRPSASVPVSRGATALKVEAAPVEDGDWTEF